MEIAGAVDMEGSPKGEQREICESISAAMMLGSGAGCAQVAAASFTAGGAEIVSASREAGHAGKFQRGWRCLRGFPL
jgi:hypothetical protein